MQPARNAVFPVTSSWALQRTAPARAGPRGQEHCDPSHLPGPEETRIVARAAPGRERAWGVRVAGRRLGSSEFEATRAPARAGAASGCLPSAISAPHASPSRRPPSPGPSARHLGLVTVPARPGLGRLGCALRLRRAAALPLVDLLASRAWQRRRPGRGAGCWGYRPRSGPSRQPEFAAARAQRALHRSHLCRLEARLALHPWRARRPRARIQVTSESRTRLQVTPLQVVVSAFRTGATQKGPAAATAGRCIQVDWQPEPAPPAPHPRRIRADSRR